MKKNTKEICMGCSSFKKIETKYCKSCEEYAALVRKKEAERREEYYKLFPSSEMYEQYLDLKKQGFY